ncbi:hypothetical protein AB1L88_25845 [Tautonia sp. JC769]|uniref:hypothetical protein n=1 Tax=Tautonia sp. JC769 TaxID=3232135 RepID=UPI00345A20E8
MSELKYGRPSQWSEETGALIGFFLMVLTALSYPVQVLLRVPLVEGKKHFGAVGLIGTLFGFPLFVEISGLDSPVPLSHIDPWIGPAWMLMGIAYPLRWFLTKVNRSIRHTRFIGKSWVQIVIPRIGPLGGALFDLGLAYGLMVLIEPYSRIVGEFLLLSACCNAFSIAMLVARDRRRWDIASDAMIEGMAFNERMQRY